MENTHHTKHGIMQAKARMGLNRKDAENIFDRAVLRGKSAEDFTDARKSEYLRRKSGTFTTAKVYNGFCYIVGEDDVVVTTFSLPNWWNKKERYNGKEKIRNAKKFYSMNANLLTA